MVKRYVLGTDGSNDIIDEAGNVTDQFIIYGLAGDDDLSGGELNDWIYGGAGNDFLMGMAASISSMATTVSTP